MTEGGSSVIVLHVSAQVIGVAHSQDPDDAFRFYALLNNKVDTRGLLFRNESIEIHTLNDTARRRQFEVTVVSFAAYPYVAQHYCLLRCGASVGDGYGPLIVAKRPLTRADLETSTVAVGGTTSTAFLAMKLFCPPCSHRVVPPDEIIPSLEQGKVDAALVIHEAQMAYRSGRFSKVSDLGEWWRLGTGLPLPLSGVAVRRDLSSDTTRRITETLRDSIQYGLDHRKEALDYAVRVSRQIDLDRASKFIAMYVNTYSLDLGEHGHKALDHLFRLGHEAGVLPQRVELEFPA